jgi:hypothetical protein
MNAANDLINFFIHDKKEAPPGVLIRPVWTISGPSGCDEDVQQWPH